MEMLGGSFGKGYAVYNSHSAELKLQRHSSFQTKTIQLNEIKDLQQMSMEAKKKAGETVGLGVTGMWLGGLLGPVGGLAGLALGAIAGGHKNKIVFGLVLHSNESCLFKASMAEFGELQAAFLKTQSASSISASIPAARTSNPTNDVTTSRVQKKPRKKKTSPQIIKGRSRASVPIPKTPLAIDLIQLQQTVEDNPDLMEFHSFLNSRIDYINELKWKYFDDLINDAEVKECICLAASWYIHRVDLCKNQVKYYRQNAQRYLRMAFDARTRAGFFNKTETEKRAQEYEKTAQGELAHASSEEQSAKKYEALKPIIVELVNRYVEPHYFSHSMEKYEQRNGSLNQLTKSLGFKIIEELKSEHPIEPIDKETRDGRTVSRVEPNERSEAAESIEKRLAKLVSLREKGVIAEEEYQRQRTAIISEL